jgi:FkbM family methyltransferase
MVICEYSYRDYPLQVTVKFLPDPFNHLLLLTVSFLFRSSVLRDCGWVFYLTDNIRFNTNRPLKIIIMNLTNKAIKAIKSKFFWKFYSFFIEKTFQPKISYSQNGEDIIIYGIFEALSKKRIFYLDVGGYHPYTGSNTALFYLTGSKGIVIEPNPELFKQFPLKRPRDINLNIGVSIQSGTQLFFLSSSGALGSLIPDEEKKSSPDIHELDPISIPVQTLPEIIKENADGKVIDFLSLDIEGMELPVLRTLDFRELFPLVICVETARYSPSRQKEKRTDILDFLATKGYFVYADTYINTIFVRSDIWQQNS